LQQEANCRGVLPRDLAARLLMQILAGGDLAPVLGEGSETPT
jgi:hypothetical protein